MTGGILQPTIDFGQRLAKAGKKIWVRFVLVPGLTSSEENVENVAKICESLRRRSGTYRRAWIPPAWPSEVA